MTSTVTGGTTPRPRRGDVSQPRGPGGRFVARTVVRSEPISAGVDPLDDGDQPLLTVLDDPLPEDRYLNRELSWLDFNARVLTLAEDPEIPLLERAKFLAIFA